MVDASAAAARLFVVDRTSPEIAVVIKATANTPQLTASHRLTRNSRIDLRQSRLRETLSLAPLSRESRERQKDRRHQSSRLGRSPVLSALQESTKAFQRLVIVSNFNVKH